MKREEIDYLLEKYSGRVVDLCYEIIEGIQEKSFDEQIDIMGYLCEKFGYVQSDKTIELPQHISEDDLESLEDMHGKFVDDILEASLKKAYTNEMDSISFYELLWGAITKSGILSDIEEKTFALYYILIDRRIPYFSLNKGMRMEDDEFERIKKSNYEVIKRIRFVLSNSFSQEASILLDEILKAESYEEQVVLFAFVLGLLRENQKRLFEKIQEMIAEESE